MKEGDYVIFDAKYQVVYVCTPDQLAADGMPKMAELLRKQGVVEQIGLRKPKGRGAWVVNRYSDGYGSLTRV